MGFGEEAEILEPPPKGTGLLTNEANYTMTPEQRQRLVERALARARKGKGSEKTVRRLREAGYRVTPVSVETDAPNAGAIDPRSLVSPEEVSARREGNFYRAAMRARLGRPMTDKTRKRLQAGVGRDYNEQGEFEPVGYTPESVKALSGEDFDRLIKHYREKARSKIKPELRQYDL